MSKLRVTVTASGVLDSSRSLALSCSHSWAQHRRSARNHKRARSTSWRRTWLAGEPTGPREVHSRDHRLLRNHKPARRRRWARHHKLVRMRARSRAHSTSWRRTWRADEPTGPCAVHSRDHRPLRNHKPARRRRWARRRAHSRARSTSWRRTWRAASPTILRAVRSRDHRRLHIRMRARSHKLAHNHFRCDQTIRPVHSKY